jgi:hypothetical protein
MAKTFKTYEVPGADDAASSVVLASELIVAEKGVVHGYGYCAELLLKRTDPINAHLSQKGC